MASCKKRTPVAYVFSRLSTSLICIQEENIRANPRAKKRSASHKSQLSKKSLKMLFKSYDKKERPRFLPSGYSRARKKGDLCLERTTDRAVTRTLALPQEKGSLGLTIYYSSSSGLKLELSQASLKFGS